MFTEKRLRSNPHLIKAFMGLPSEAFWELVNNVEQRLPEAQRQRLEREDRQRATGAGRNYTLSLVIRIAVVLTYMRLHIPQQAVAAMYAVNQWDVSRELRRLLPIIEEVLPSPDVWQRDQWEDGTAGQSTLTLEQLSDGRAIVDATEQTVLRPEDSETRKEHYSGKKKPAHSRHKSFVMGNITSKR